MHLFYFLFFCLPTLMVSRAQTCHSSDRMIVCDRAPSKFTVCLTENIGQMTYKIKLQRFIALCSL